MSLRDAIAKRWHQRFHKDIYNGDKDYIVLRGKKLRPAKYYDTLYDIINPDHLKKLKEIRKQKNKDTTPEELRARAEIAHARTIYRNQV